LEEESLPLASAHTVAESSLGSLRIAGNHGIEPQQEEDGQASTQSELQAADKAKGVALSPGGSPHAASASIVVEGNSSSTPLASIPRGGSGDGDAAKDEDFWYGNECPVMEEPLEHDVVM